MVLRGTTRLTRKGQITIPAEIREALHLHGGEDLEVQFDEIGCTLTIVDPREVIERTYGALKPRLVLSVEEEKHLSRSARADYLAQKHSAQS